MVSHTVEITPQTNLVRFRSTNPRREAGCAQVGVREHLLLDFLRQLGGE